MQPQGEQSRSLPQQFRPTRWSLILRARDSRPSRSRDAMAELYQLYWYPLYAYARKRGINAEDAADILQGFFSKLLDGSLLGSADPAKGRFRSYLLGALKHFISDDWDRARAQRRGGGVSHISVDDAERRYALEPAHELTAEKIFERRWALTILHRVLEQLRDEASRAGKQDEFHQLKDLIAGPLPDKSYAELAAERGTSEGAVKVAVHRLRRRYREVLMEHIAETVATPEEVDDELQHLREALTGM